VGRTAKRRAVGKLEIRAQDADESHVGDERGAER